MENAKNTANMRLMKPGPLCTVQDLGRTNCQHLGLCSGGALDLYAYHWANRLLDNPRGAACLEITLGPCVIHFSHTTRIALCGALSTPSIGDKQLLPWATHDISAGQTLNIPVAKKGLRYYMAVKGGILAKRYFDSCSSINSDGSLCPLVAGTVLAYGTETGHTKALNRSAHWQSIPDYQQGLVLRLHPCYQYKHFSSASKNQFFNSSYNISPDSNRMGYRLQGHPLIWENRGIISEGIAYGAVQIPPDGQPIVLLNDRQTIGGYPKIGCVAAEDCYQLAQRRPGQNVRFQLI